MSEPFIPFARPDIGDQEIAAVTDVLRSGWVTTGPRCRDFEESFTRYLGAPVQSLAVNSATAGLHLALEALGIGPGDEVLVPTLTFTATAEVVRYLGADPVFVDSDPVTLCMDVAGARQAVSSRTRAMIPVHYGGLACDMDGLMGLAQEHGLAIVEDAAHALPSTHRGRLVGTLPTRACVFSFYANKTMTTGEGGMVVTTDQSLAQRMRVMRLHGINRDAFDRFTRKGASWYYEVVAPGFKYNLTDMGAAMGIVQLRRVDAMAERRSQIAGRYRELLGGLPLVLPAMPAQGDRHAWHLYVVRMAEGSPIGRDAMIEGLTAAGIGTSVHYLPLHRHPYWRDRYGLSPGAYPVADAAFGAMFSLPIYSGLTDAEVERVASVMRGIIEPGSR